MRNKDMSLLKMSNLTESLSKKYRLNEYYDTFEYGKFLHRRNQVSEVISSTVDKNGEELHVGDRILKEFVQFAKKYIPGVSTVIRLVEMNF